MTKTAKNIALKPPRSIISPVAESVSDNADAYGTGVKRFLHIPKSHGLRIDKCLADTGMSFSTFMIKAALEAVKRFESGSSPFAEMPRTKSESLADLQWLVQHGLTTDVFRIIYRNQRTTKCDTIETHMKYLSESLSKSGARLNVDSTNYIVAQRLHVIRTMYQSQIGSTSAREMTDLAQEAAALYP
jgi:hypothetical protein